MSAGPSPNRSASMRPGHATFSWVTRTAFGSPLVPDVKISMNKSSGPRRAKVTGAPRCDANASAHAGDSTST